MKFSACNFHTPAIFFILITEAVSKSILMIQQGIIQISRANCGFIA